MFVFNNYDLEQIKNKKKKNFDIIFAIESVLDPTDFLIKVYSKTSPNNRYSIIPRLSYTNKKKDTDWKTLDKQIEFQYTDDTFNVEIESLHDKISESIESTLEIYKIDHIDIVNVQLLFYTLEYTTNIKMNKFNADSLGKRKELINVSKSTSVINKYISVNVDDNTLGILLDKVIVDDKIVSIKLSNNDIVDIKGNKFKMDNININTEFYQNRFGNKEFIFGINKVEDTRIVEVFTTNGTKLHKFADTLLGHDIIKRDLDNITVYINKSGVFNREINTKFNYMKPSIFPQDYNFEKIGTLDIETYKINTYESKPYLIGFHDGEETKYFYINKDLNSDSILLECLDNMVIPKYNKFMFYAHNLSGFDSTFLLRGLAVANKSEPKYKVELNLRGDSQEIICITLSRKVEGKLVTIKIADSYKILSSSLNDLCRTFNPSVKKSYFPYEFINSNTLFYEGELPSKMYFNEDIRYKNDFLEFYDNIKGDKWSVREYSIKYIENDLISLYLIMKEFARRIYNDTKIPLTKVLTISGLAMQIYLSRYYNNNLPLISRKSIYDDIKETHYGGMTEVFKPHGKELFYYDVNSLYPYSGLNAMPGLNCMYTEIINKNIKDVKDELFGFYLCDINTSNNYIGLLPFRQRGQVLMPQGTWTGWYFSEELKYAQENGYDINVISGYTFDKVYNAFDSYVEHFYKEKLNSTVRKDDVGRSIAKSLLNNLLGRFGLDINKSVTELVTDDRLNEILQHKKIRSIKHIDNLNMVTYNKDVSYEICKEYNVDYTNILKDLSNKSSNINSSEKWKDVSIAIASAITSYSRIYMNKIKNLLLSMNGNIYYTDTDSIVTDIELPSEYVGDELGKFKLVYKVKEGYFISNKLYCLITEKDGNIIRTKGFERGPLTYEDFIKLYNGNHIDAIRYETTRNYNSGTVQFRQPQPLRISPYSYTKRAKIYDNNKWVNTSPIQINSKKGYHTYSNKDINMKWTIITTYIVIILSYVILYTSILLILLGLCDDSSSYANSNCQILANIIDNNNICTENKTLMEKLISLFENKPTYKDNYKIDMFQNRSNIIYKNLELKAYNSPIIEGVVNKLQLTRIKELESSLLKQKTDHLNMYDDLLRDLMEMKRLLSSDAKDIDYLLLKAKQIKSASVSPKI